MPVLGVLWGFCSIARGQNMGKAVQNGRKSELRRAQRGGVAARQAAAGDSDPGAGGLPSQAALCVISLYKF